LAQSLVPAIPAAPQASSKVGESQPEIMVPAGTKVLMALVSPLHSVSAAPDSGVYLETVFAVVAGNRVVIPPHTRVHGSVTRSARPGRVKGRAQLEFHFATVILPNNFVLPISGSLEALPGSARYEKNSGEVIQPVDQIDKDMATIVSTGAVGAILGSLSYGTVSTAGGSLIGAGVGLGKVLFTRGDDIHLPEGTRVEMVLDHDLIIPVSELTFPPSKPEVTLLPQPRSDESDDSSRQAAKKRPPRRGLSSILFPR